MNLHEGLAKLLADADAYAPDSYTLDRDEVRALLAAHPAEPAPVANPERVAEMLHHHDCRCDDADHLVEYRSVARFLLAAGVFRDESTVKAELAELIAVRSQELIGGGPGGIAAAIAREAVTS